mgnify:CR=1 FL=1
MKYKKLKVHSKLSTQVLLCERIDGKYLVIEKPYTDNVFQEKRSIFNSKIQAETYYNMLKQEKGQLKMYM